MGIESGIPGVKPFVCSESREVRTSSFGRKRSSHPMDRTIWKNRENVNQHAGDSSSDLYLAKPMNGHAWIHGTKSGRMVHVGAVDAPVTLADVNGHPRRDAAPHRVLGSRHVVQCFVAESNRILAVPGTRLWGVPGSQKLHIFRSSNGNPEAVGREEGRRTERIAQSITSPRSRRAPARTPPPPLAPHRR